MFEGEYALPHGRIIVEECNEKKSRGRLELNPGAKLEPHTRPVAERLEQLDGKSERIVDGKKVVMTPGNRIEIPPGQLHVHSNPFPEKSVTNWEFDGDIREVIREIARKNRKIK